MHGSISLGGKVAKWAPGKGLVATVQTERLLRVECSPLRILAAKRSNPTFPPSFGPRPNVSYEFVVRCAFVSASDSLIASASKKYRADFVSRNRYSCALLQRSVTLSGMGFGLAQIISCLNHQPSA